jgi:hypothetical protein
MQFHDNEWLPASLCTIDGFDGTVEAVAGGGGNSGGFDASAGNTGGAAGNGGYATTAQDVAARWVSSARQVP